MGIINSRLFKADCTTSPCEEKTVIADPRSPGGDVHRTPILIEKSKPYLETDLDNLTTERRVNSAAMPLRTKLLRGLKLDPRSPTVGINRTPILLETPAEPALSRAFCDSPVSIYSSNFNDTDSMIDVTAPPDPSVMNVSGFDDFDDVEQAEEINNIIDNLNVSEQFSEDSLLENNEEIKDDTLPETQEEKSEATEPLTKLQVVDGPTTKEAQKLMDEILNSIKTDDDEFIENIIQKNSAKNKYNPKNLTVYQIDLNVKESGHFKDKPKTRTPLSNITASANSPSQPLQVKKSNRIKILADTGLENTLSPQNRLAEWDQDNTVII